MKKPIAPQRPSLSARTALQMVLGAALFATLIATLIAPTTALAAEPDTGSVTAAPTAEPLSTEEWQSDQKRQQPETGRATRNWLQAQASREQASANRPSLSGPALRRTHDRYLRTFEVDIPQQLRESLPANK